MMDFLVGATRTGPTFDDIARRVAGHPREVTFVDGTEVVIVSRTLYRDMKDAAGRLTEDPA